MKISLNYHKLIKLEKYENNSLIEVPDKCTVRDLISLLEIPKNRMGSILVHVNNEPSWNATVLKENDSVKLFLMVGGG